LMDDKNFDENLDEDSLNEELFESENEKAKSENQKISANTKQKVQ
jgi:hypothetical protein